MEEEQIQTPVEQEVYKERPAWQVWAARIGLVLFLIFIAVYHILIARGGM